MWLKEKENQLAIHPVSKLLNTENQILYRMPLHRTAGPKIVVMQLMQKLSVSFDRLPVTFSSFPSA